MENSLAPILVFCYNRPKHTANLIDSLINSELSSFSELFVFIDAPKIGASKEDINKNSDIKEMIKGISHFKKITVFESETNKGVDKSIMDGVTKIISVYGKVIVLEDDLIVANSFLKFMNWALKAYENNDRIYSVNGFMFPLDYELNNIQLLPLSSAWGWGTWKDRWCKFQFDEENRNIINQSSQLKERFNLPGVDYAKMLISHKECWDINWYYYIFKQSGLNVFPSKALVKNTGFDGSGVHCNDDDFIQDFDLVNEINLNKQEEMDLYFLKSYYDYFIKIEKENVRKNNFISKLKNKIKHKI